MQQNQLDFETMEKALLAVWTNFKCPYSGHTDWEIHPRLVEMRDYSSGGLRLGYGGVTPAIMVVCTGCGHIALFSAATLNLAPGAGGTTDG